MVKNARTKKNILFWIQLITFFESFFHHISKFKLKTSSNYQEAEQEAEENIHLVHRFDIKSCSFWI